MWGTLLATSLACCGPKAYHLTIEKSSSNTMIAPFMQQYKLNMKCVIVLHDSLIFYRHLALIY